MKKKSQADGVVFENGHFVSRGICFGAAATVFSGEVFQSGF
jgi:hypothetical protein